MGMGICTWKWAQEFISNFIGFLSQSPPCGNLFSTFWLPGILQPESWSFLLTLLHNFCNYTDVQDQPAGGQRENKKQQGSVPHRWSQLLWSEMKVPLPQHFRILQVQPSLQMLPLPLPPWDFLGAGVWENGEKKKGGFPPLSQSIRRLFSVLWARARGFLLELPLCRYPHLGFMLLIGAKQWQTHYQFDSTSNSSPLPQSPTTI